jgi:uncharacterized protein (TIGR02266 family)
MPIDMPHQNPNRHERRKAPRHAVDIDVEERTGGALYYQRATNLSAGGLHLGSTLAHPPGTRVSLAVKLPGASEELRLDGEVVARHPEEVGMAVRFIALSDRERAAIASIVKRRAS